MDFRPLNEIERKSLDQALRRNAGDGAALLTDRRDTSFRGTGEVTDDEVIEAIKSVPCHYGESRETMLALAMLRDDPDYIKDARTGAPLGNSVVGSLLSLFHGCPRQYAEPAVIRALAILDREAANV